MKKGEGGMRNGRLKRTLPPLKTALIRSNVCGCEKPGNSCCKAISLWYIPRSVCPKKGGREDN